ncbi:hypothetical protein MCOR25_004396 [Pyricularia grisea]|nr:hypothetical protein MCOR25_004396 [Pyricularia grisea]
MRADELLEKHRNTIRTMMAPIVEESLRLHSEDDAARAINVYLNHLVKIVLDLEGHATFTQSNTMSNVKSKLAQGKPNTQGKLRGDIVWYAPSVGGGLDRSFAVIEIKRHDRINPSLIGQSFPPMPLEALEKLYEKSIDNPRRWQASFLPLLQQATAYAVDYKVRHVALCSYKVLALIKFTDPVFTTRFNAAGPERGSSRSMPSRGDGTRQVYFEATTSGECGTSGDEDSERFAGRWFTMTVLGNLQENRTHEFRKALLGFLAEARDEILLASMEQARLRSM